MFGRRRGASKRRRPGEADWVVRELGRLDPWTFWVSRTDEGSAADLAVVGTTGAFLISVCDLEGYLVEERGRLVVDGRPIEGLRELRRAAKAAGHRLGASAVFTDVHPIVCLTRAVAGLSRTARGVRVVRLEDLVAEITDRERTIRPGRAKKGAEVLGRVVPSGQGAVPDHEDEG